MVLTAEPVALVLEAGLGLEVEGVDGPVLCLGVVGDAVVGPDGVEGIETGGLGIGVGVCGGLITGGFCVCTGPSPTTMDTSVTHTGLPERAESIVTLIGRVPVIGVALMSI